MDSRLPKKLWSTVFVVASVPFTFDQPCLAIETSAINVQQNTESNQSKSIQRIQSRSVSLVIALKDSGLGQDIKI